MAFDRLFLGPMIHEIVVDHYSATDGYGKRTYATASTFQARIEFKKRIVKDAQSRDIVSNTLLLVAPYDVDGSTSATIGASDKVTLPVSFTPRTPPIISVEPHYDHEGFHHWEVYV